MFIPLKDENPTQRFPAITVALITLNILIFLYQIFSPQGLQYSIYRMGAIPYEITHFTTLTFFPRISPPLTLLTSLFLHGSVLHLFGNMLYLWIFGNNIEDFLGPLRFSLFYLLTGLGASLFHIISHPASKVPMIGASGAIAGVLGAYFLLYPRAVVYRSSDEHRNRGRSGLVCTYRRIFNRNRSDRNLFEEKTNPPFVKAHMLTIPLRFSILEHHSFSKV